MFIKKIIFIYLTINALQGIAQDEGIENAIKLNPIKSLMSEHTLSYERRNDGFGAEIELGIIKNKHKPGTYGGDQWYPYPVFGHWNGFSINLTLKNIRPSGFYYGVNFLGKYKYIKDIWAGYTGTYDAICVNYSQNRYIFGVAYRIGYIAAYNILEPYFGFGLRTIVLDTDYHYWAHGALSKQYTGSPPSSENPIDSGIKIYPYINFGLKIGIFGFTTASNN